MIKVTLEFETAVEAAAYLTGGQAPAPHFAPNVAETAPAAYNNNAAPQQYAPTPQAPAQYAAPAPTQGQYANQAQAAAYAPAPAPQQAQPLAQNGPAINSTQIAQAAQAFAKVHGPKGAKAKLTEFGLTKISDARPDQYQALLNALAV